MASIQSVASNLLTTRSFIRPAASWFLRNNNSGVGHHGLTTRSIVRPAASGFLNINNGVGHLLHAPVFANCRGLATLPLYGGFINPFQTASRKVVASKLLIANSRSAVISAVASTHVLASRSFSTNNTNTDTNTNTDKYPGSSEFSVLDVLDGFSPPRWLARKFQRFTNYPAKLIKPSKVDDTYEYTYVYIHMDGIKPENVKVYFDRGALLIEGEADDELNSIGGFKKFVCWYYLPDIDSPDKIYNFSNIKAEMNLKNVGELKLTIPKLQENETRFVVKVGN